MKESFSKKETIEILSRALTAKDREADKSYKSFKFNDLETMAGEFDISKAELMKAATEITQTKEQKRDQLYPEIVAIRWIDGRLTKQDIENFFSELKLEFGGSHHQWTGSPAEIHQIGSTWEYSLKNASVLLTDKGNGYQLQVIKQQFFHGNNLEAILLAIPSSFLLGLLPVTAAMEWLSIFTAVIVAVVCFAASFSIVIKFTQKRRSDTVADLLRITEFAEMLLKENGQAKDSEGVQNKVMEGPKADDINQTNKLRS